MFRGEGLLFGSSKFKEYMTISAACPITLSCTSEKRKLLPILEPQIEVAAGSSWGDKLCVHVIVILKGAGPQHVRVVGHIRLGGIGSPSAISLN